MIIKDLNTYLNKVTEGTMERYIVPTSEPIMTRFNRFDDMDCEKEDLESFVEYQVGHEE